MNENKKSYYAIIPANVRYDESLTPNAKLLYGEITALCNERGYCWASNSYFAQLYGVSNVSVSKWINQLVDNGYLSSEMHYKEGSKEILNRYLRIVNDPIKEKLNTPQRKVKEPIKQKFKDNNTTNTTDNTTDNINSPASAEPPLPCAEEKLEPIPYKEIVDYLNEKAGKSYRHTTKKTQELIRARANEGFELDDFKRVIDTKTADWKGDKEMDKFLRPYTLFGTKFEGYLQEEPRRSSSQSVEDYYKEMQRKEYKLDAEGYIF